MGPGFGSKSYRQAQQEQDAEDGALEAAYRAFPDHVFIELMTGWLVVPKGTPVVMGADLDSVVNKLRAARDSA